MTASPSRSLEPSLLGTGYRYGLTQYSGFLPRPLYSAYPASGFSVSAPNKAFGCTLGGAANWGNTGISSARVTNAARYEMLYQICALEAYEPADGLTD